MLDLENREVLIQYLLEKGVIHSDIPYEVNYCRGGVSCIAALIETEGKTMLVKQGRAKLAVKEDWHADPARMKIEAIANDFYNKCIPQSAPAVLFYDEENCIMVRDAAPASCRMWKEGVCLLKKLPRHSLKPRHGCGKKGQKPPPLNRRGNGLGLK